MPFVIKNMRLDKMEFLSVVDKGASGDEENRPRIELFKRKKGTMLEQIKKMFKGQKIDLEKMGLPQLVGAIDELGLSDEQKAGVLKLLEAFKGGAEAEPAPEPEPVEAAADENPPPAEGDEKKEDEPMQKRDEQIEAIEKRHAEEKAALEKRLADLEEQAELVELEKRAKEFEWLPMEQAEVVQLLKRNKGDEKFVEMLRKVNEASKKSPILRVAGATVPGGESDATARLAKRVKELRKEDPKLNEAQAKARAWKEDPELYRATKEAAQ